MCLLWPYLSCLLSCNCVWARCPWYVPSLLLNQGTGFRILWLLANSHGALCVTASKPPGTVGSQGLSSVLGWRVDGGYLLPLFCFTLQTFCLFSLQWKQHGAPTLSMARELSSHWVTELARQSLVVVGLWRSRRCHGNIDILCRHSGSLGQALPPAPHVYIPVQVRLGGGMGSGYKDLRASLFYVHTWCVHCLCMSMPTCFWDRNSCWPAACERGEALLGPVPVSLVLGLQVHHARLKTRQSKTNKQNRDSGNPVQVLKLTGQAVSHLSCLPSP